GNLRVTAFSIWIFPEAIKAMTFGKSQEPEWPKLRCCEAAQLWAHWS
ncbi:hypothetical protein J2809_004274, partial [Arthrobacter pascens]|nr:hypothetical protein [Arthrobacter pascens]